MIELSETFKLLEAYDISLVVIGLGILGLAVLLHRFERLPFSFPILSLALGYAAFALPLGLTPPDPRMHGLLAVHLTEIGVIISLMGVGLKIDRSPNLRTWSTTWRMLGICMPLTIVCVALWGWWMVGLAPAAAVMLAVALAPTDPVLASDVQVGEPEAEVPGDGSSVTDEGTGEDEMPAEREDELRFTLTSEAGLNDSLAFPFTYLALLMLTEGPSPADWFVQWLLIDVFYRVIVGVAAGVAIGWALSHVLLELPVQTEREKMKAGVGALAGTLLLYGVTECLAGYGFLAVFVGALTLRHKENTQQEHKSLHTFADQAEQLLMTVILIAVGGAIAGGLLASLTWEAALLGVLLIFIIRPGAGLLGLIGEQRLTALDRCIASFFGIRGIGCLFYLAYGLHKGEFPMEDELWAACVFTIVLSVVVHGVLASPVMRFRDRRMKQHDSEPDSAEPMKIRMS
ncbi:cation:proton antiporter [Allorhodopirellula solitaria]|uniref:K(+)/H(+) antiporter NhaP n=1 Tax=Allorhodopirellula solitaria TaxID=2527987 RepID=A0A5C5WMC7_9BACT|nr:cation:proton antiporter [Allorhodopirellula solitaria]TWT51770.1 K(+)/H(+) antiporter NhaP [Allorhodopirellula solitaria]